MPDPFLQAGSIAPPPSELYRTSYHGRHAVVRGPTAEPTSVQNRVSAGTNRCLFPDIRHLGLDPATAPGHVTSSYVRSSPTSKSNVLLSDGPLAHYARSRQVTLDPVPPAASNVLLSDGPRQVSSSYVRSSPASNVPPLRWATSGLVKLRQIQSGPVQSNQVRSRQIKSRHVESSRVGQVKPESSQVEPSIVPHL